MTRLRIVFGLILILTLSLPAHADKASSAYNRGMRAESQKQYDAAYEAFKQAYSIKPKEPNMLLPLCAREAWPPLTM